MRIIFCTLVMVVLAALSACTSSGIIRADPPTVAVAVAADSSTVPAAPSLALPSLFPSTPALPLRAEIGAHIENGIEIAKAGNDAAGVQCGTALKTWVGTLPLMQSDVQPDPVLPAATGPLGEAETLRIKAKLAEARINAAKSKVTALRAIVDAGIPESIVVGCAVVVTDAKVLRDKILLLIGIAGL